ncbi:D-hexose-6-phosphate mutarotase [Hahella ganghwensis]|uniref:D-hexose-6-phosphate mutarotase n=1 Tax=Hahella ganghwensis TaxID=286420 RepID=UPI000380B239|nr:D-hexose-6-phosphate mutarotase [Hahella ganghwensis]
MPIDIDLSDLKTVKVRDAGAFEILEIERDDCIGSISLMGGQVLTYSSHGQRPILWENSRLELSASAALRQGIPICWPWFGPLSQNQKPVIQQFQQDQPPSHGYVRDSIWELVSVNEKAEFTEVILAKGLDQPGLQGLGVTMSYRFSDRLECRLTSHNQTKQPVNLSFALHTYLAVSDIKNISIHDLDGIPYIDSLDRGAKHVQAGHVAFDKEVDRIYYNTPPLIRVKDAGWNRTISLEAPESHSSVIWNPWIDKSKRLSQFTPDSYREMVCVETARAASDFVEIPASEQHQVTLTLRSSS